MAGYSKLYCVGEEGGYQGADGISPIFFQILLGDGHRQWLEGHYFDASITPLGKLNVIIPEQPNHPDMLLDACIAFFPEHFRACSLLADVERQLGEQTHLDFDRHGSDIPHEWTALRTQARPYFEALGIWEAHLKPLRRAPISNHLP